MKYKYKIMQSNNVRRVVTPTISSNTQHHHHATKGNRVTSRLRTKTEGLTCGVRVATV